MMSCNVCAVLTFFYFFNSIFCELSACFVVVFSLNFREIKNELFAKNFRESFVFSSQFFRENKNRISRKNESENFRPNPSIEEFVFKIIKKYCKLFVKRTFNYVHCLGSEVQIYLFIYYLQLTVIYKKTNIHTL
jgi:hypothetical protein